MPTGYTAVLRDEAEAKGVKFDTLFQMLQKLTLANYGSIPECQRQVRDLVQMTNPESVKAVGADINEVLLAKIDYVIRRKTGDRTHADAYLTADRYLAFLRRVRDQIANGSELVDIESSEIGDKFTSCSWGFCSMQQEQWPDIEDWIFQNEYGCSRRSNYCYHKDGETIYYDLTARTKYRDREAEIPQECPMDSDGSKGPSGCFYRCRVFQQRKLGEMTREKALELYDQQIARVEDLLQKKWLREEG